MAVYSRHAILVELKWKSLREAYLAYKEAEKNGTLRVIPLTEEQRQIIQSK